MAGSPKAPRAVVLTPAAEATLTRTTERWQGFLAVKIDDLAENAEPDGATRFVAPAWAGVGALEYHVPPWRIIYRIRRDVVTILLMVPVSM